MWAKIKKFFQESNEMVDYLGWGYMILTILMLVISVLYSLIKFLNFRAKFNVETMSLSILVGLWMITGELMRIAPNLDYSTLQNLANWGFVALIFVYLRLSLIFSKFIFNTSIKRTSLVAAVGLSLLAGLRLADIVIGDNLVFSPPGEPTKNLIVSILILIAHLSYSLIFLQANYFFHRHFYKMITPKISRVMNGTISLVLIAILAVTTYSLMNFVDKMVALEFLPYLRIFIGLSVFMIIHYCEENPVILLVNKANTNQLVQEGYLGFYLVSMKDSGPTPIASSKVFNTRYGITEAQSTLFASTMITVIGIGNSFKNSIFMVPFPQVSDLTALSFSFTLKDSDLKDPRMRQVGNAIFSIIAPNSLSPLISLRFELFNFFLSLIEDVREVEELGDLELMCRITKDIIRQLF